MFSLSLSHNYWISEYTKKIEFEFQNEEIRLTIDAKHIDKNKGESIWKCLVMCRGEKLMHYALMWERESKFI